MLNDLLGLLFPRLCPGCDESLSKAEGAICDACLLAIEETNCHKSLKDNELYYRFAGKVDIAGAAALFYFDKRGRMKKMMQALKYGNQPKVGLFLGQHYGEILKESGVFDHVEEIIPVPLHKSRMAERGYNQSEQIAKGLSAGLQVALNAKSLVRQSKTETQTRKGKNERWENVKSVFEVKQPTASNVILVDDVITTGATLEACIRTLFLQENHVDNIYVLALGMARFG